jgi:hypothetical protein
MAYFIYNKFSEKCIYKIAENDSDLNSLKIPEEDYLIVTANQNDFDSVRLNNKYVLNYNGSVQLQDLKNYSDRIYLTQTINRYIKTILYFLDAQPQSVVFQKWLNYSNLLKSLDVNTIIPSPNEALEISLEQYLQNQGQTSLNILQLP